MQSPPLFLPLFSDITISGPRGRRWATSPKKQIRAGPREPVFAVAPPGHCLTRHLLVWLFVRRRRRPADLPSPFGVLGTLCLCEGRVSGELRDELVRRVLCRCDGGRDGRAAAARRGDTRREGKASGSSGRLARRSRPAGLPPSLSGAKVSRPRPRPRGMGGRAPPNIEEKKERPGGFMATRRTNMGPARRTAWVWTFCPLFYFFLCVCIWTLL